MSYYFKNLNYTLANEDTSLELQVLDTNPGHIVCICGSGARVLPLLSKNPSKLSLVDFSTAQIALTQLRLKALEHFDHESFIQFLGYQSISPKKREELFYDLPLNKEFQVPVAEFLKTQSWAPLIYMGKYEKTLIKMSKLVQLTMGKSLEEIKKIDSKDQWDDYYQNDFSKIRWSLLLLALGNNTILNALLYKGQHPKNNLTSSYHQYYKNLFEKLFKLTPPKHSFFLQLFLFGMIIDEAHAPIEAQYKYFDRMKMVRPEIQTFQGDLVKIISQEITGIDFISFSDTLSYFPFELGRDYMQKIYQSLNPGAKTVHRYYLHKTKQVDLKGYSSITNEYRQAINNELTQIYDIEVYRKD